ncbi:hypothetical protein [Pseudalkalibacillus caeni]|uniref:Flagellar protein FliT n=1 Tax=Exobacillus caeni TaxID=2574798 RepID=A0A5R9F2S5_9BACL|nr:hypothetical protein [Pseudalkalibacillus caeni]TLS36616.1 hypothetical protein FCL54_13925 [Pseudalkalibacillus caeni]
MRTTYLEKLVDFTVQLKENLDSIKTSMDQNEPEQLESFDELVLQREVIISKLDEEIQGKETNWSEEEKKLIQELQQMEAVIEPRLRELYNSFSNQLTKVQLGKAASKKYQPAYANTYSDGSFIDQRR